MYIISNKNKNKFIQLLDSKAKVTLNISDAHIWDKEKRVNNYLNNLSNSIKNKDVWVVYNIDTTLNFYDNIKPQNSSTDNANVQNINKRTNIKLEVRKDVYRKTKGYCALCGNFVDYEDFTLDHIIPLSKGGTNDISNLQCACKVCNNIKTDILPDEFLDKISQIIIHNIKVNYNKKVGNSLLHNIIKAKFSFKKVLQS